VIQAHYLRKNHNTRLPRCFVYLDTEAWQVRGEHVETQTFQLAAAAHDCTRPERKRQHLEELETFDTPGDVWDWVTAKARPGRRCVLVAHNLAYDLRVADTFRRLPALGWRLTGARLDRGQAWCQWRNARRSLTMVDSVSWLPTSLENLGTMVGRPKLPLPADHADAGQWRERCVTDVLILRDCWRRVMAWLEREDLGNFKVTGAGQAWAGFRHRFMTHPILVHGDRHVWEQERAASWAGRCEAWRHGDLGHGPWHEWDLERCYATIAAECDVPVRLIGHTGPLTPVQRIRRASGKARLSRVQVTTDVPVVPTRGPHGIVWPTGTFDTTLWENEVALAVLNGAKVRTLESWVYSKRPALAAWGQWVLAELDRKPADLDPVVRVVLKHWSRALIGRFASRYTDWQPWGEAPNFDVCLGRMTPLDGGERADLLQLGHDLYVGTPADYGDNSLPQVMSWIMAEARCRLWRVMEAAGFDNLVYVDTDGVIVDDAGHQALKAARLPGLRVKRTFRSLTVLGPRQVIAAGKLKAAGVPSSARQDADGSWLAEVWTSLPTSLRWGEADRVTIRERRVHLHGTDNRRTHIDGNRTEAVTV
jgi:hypothetical protein